MSKPLSTSQSTTDLKNLDCKLPFEILQEIYSYFRLPDDYFSTHPAPNITISISMEKALSQVSTYWRSATLAYPPLYAVANWMDWPIEKLRVWAQRGAPAGLSLYLSYSSQRHPLTIAKPLDPAVLDLVLSMRPHLRALRLRIIAVSVEDETTETLLQPFPAAPMLRTLRIDCRHRVYDAPDVINVSSDFAPNLLSLSINGDAIVKREEPWEHLQTVDLAIPYHTQTSLQLATVSHCTRLTITYTKLEHINFTNLIVFRRLERLDLQMALMGDALPLPETISFPSLKFVNLIVDGGGAPPPRMFSGLHPIENLGISIRMASVETILDQITSPVNPSTSNLIPVRRVKTQLPELRAIFLKIREANFTEIHTRERFENALQEFADTQGARALDGTGKLGLISIGGVGVRNVEALRKSVPVVMSPRI